MSGSRPADGAPSTATAVENVDPAPFNEVMTTAADAADQGAHQTESPAVTEPTDKGETRETLLDVTRRALAEAESPPADQATPEGDKPPGDDTPKDAADNAEPKAEDKAQDDAEPPPFDKHPRWQQLKRETAGLKQQVEELSPLAETHRQVLAYMERNDLTAADVQQGFAIMAALRNDPAEAWKLMEPIVRSVRVFMGEELPDDLREKVETGLIDDDTARETARLRHSANFRQVRTERATTQAVERQTAAQAEAADAARANAVDVWFEGQKADPDYAIIAPLLHGETLRMQHEWRRAGRSFDQPAEAVAMMGEVWTNLRRTLAPKRQAIRSTPNSPPPASRATNARPPSLTDALRAAL